MSFPTDPNVGDTFTFEDTVWTFNGITWDRTTVGSSNSTRYASNTLTSSLLNRIATLETLLENVLILE